MNSIQILIIFCLIIGLSNWYIYYETIKQLKINKNYKYDDTIFNIINKQIQEAKLNEVSKNNNNNDNNNKINNDNNNNDNNNKINNDNNNKINNDNNNDRLFKRDIDVKYNVFYPPERRYTPLYNNNQPYILEKKSYNNYINYRQPEDVYYSPTINIPSRGYPDNYQIMGVLIEDNKASAYNIFGRKTFPGSNEYEYYIQGKINNTDIKYPLKIKKELEDNKELNIPELGIFKIKVYDYDSPKYIPY